MKTYNGRLKMTKTEIKNIQLLIEHTKRDISYEASGSYGNGIHFNTKEAEKVKEAIKDLEWIITHAIN